MSEEAVSKIMSRIIDGDVETMYLILPNLIEKKILRRFENCDKNSEVNTVDKL